MSIGEALVLTGAVLTVTSALLNLLLHGGADVRAVGRVVLAVLGPLTRPLRRRARVTSNHVCGHACYDHGGHRWYGDTTATVAYLRVPEPSPPTRRRRD